MRWIVAALLCWSLPLMAEDVTLVKDESQLKVLTPTLQGRQTLKIRLKNGLEAYLVSDPDTDKSGAALSVQVGSWGDPAGFPGMAHFCEHMLFLGTQKYPEEAGFKQYLSQNGGTFNAYTAPDHTSYMFSINNDDFKEALDRFAQFFIQPLFNASGVARESNAVDQEFSKNIEDDDYRAFQVLKILGNPQHPFQQFSSGNGETLKGISRDQLMAWYKSHYSADIMHLVLISRLSLDELKNLTLQDFGAVPDAPSKPFDARLTMLAPQFQGQWIYLQPYQNVRELQISWEVPFDIADDRSARVADLVGYILGHEGDGSLLSLLKKEGLAEGISAGSMDFGGHNHLFSLRINLTQQGVKERDRVVQECFQAIALLRKEGIPQYIFNEVQQMATIDYQYQSRRDVFSTVSRHAYGLTREPLATYPDISTRPSQYAPEEINQFVQSLVPEHGYFLLVADKALSGMQPTDKEKWTGAAYAAQAIPTTQLQSWNSALPAAGMHLPPPNPFIPTHLILLPQPAPQPIAAHLPEVPSLLPIPDRIIDDASGQAYYAQDNRYQLPTVSWNVVVATPSVTFSDAKKAVLSELYVKSVNEKINPINYTAQLAGLGFSVGASYRGIELNLQGYSEKAEFLFEEMLKNIKTVQPTEADFNIYRDGLTRRYENAAKDPPLDQAREMIEEVLYKDWISPEEKLKTIATVTYQDLLTYIQTCYAQTYSQGMFYGNLTHEEAFSAWNSLQTLLNSKPYPKDQREQRQVLRLPTGKGPFYLAKSTPVRGNAVVLMIQEGDFSFERRSVQQILSNAIEEPLFSALRTQQQTAYIVGNWAQEIERQLYSFYAIQSGSHDPRDLLARFELVVEGFLQGLGSPESEKQFNAIRAATVTSLQQPPKNLMEMALMLALLAIDYDGDFRWIDKRIEALQALTYPAFANLSKEFLGRANSRRVAVLVSGVTDSPFIYNRIASEERLRGMSSYSGR